MLKDLFRCIDVDVTISCFVDANHISNVKIEGVKQVYLYLSIKHQYIGIANDSPLLKPVPLELNSVQ